MKAFTFIILLSFFSVNAYAQNKVQGQCSAYCLDVRTQANPRTKQQENLFNRSPLLKASSFKGLISKCQSNFGTALVLAYKYKKASNSTSILTSYKFAKAETACKRI